MKVPPAEPALRGLRHLLCIVTERCNLACATCYAASGASELGMLTPERALAALELVLSSSEVPELAVSFTGGEPLLAGRGFYERVLAEGDAIAARHARAVRWEIQSNLLLLAGPDGEAWLALCSRHRVALGASIDGPPALQELHRPGAVGTIAIWRRLAAAGRPPGVLCVLSAESHRRRRELLAFFAELAPPSLKLAALRPLGRSSAGALGLEPGMLLELRVAFARALLEGGTSFDPDLYLYLRYLLEGRPADERGQSCTASRCGAGATSLSLDWDGTLYPCIQPARVRGHAIGCAEAGLVSERAARIEAFHGSEAWTVRCFGCEARRICFFGCRAIAIAAPEMLALECAVTRGLFAWLVEDEARSRALYQRLEELRLGLERAALAGIYLPRPRGTITS